VHLRFKIPGKFSVVFFSLKKATAMFAITVMLAAKCVADYYY
jgi:hypothetical protein